MKKKLLAALLAVILVLVVIVPTSFAQPSGTQEDPFVTNFESRYASPEMLYRPQVRWWMAQGYHTDATLAEEAQSLKDSGFGGMEVLAMTASDVNSAPGGAQRYSWGSAEWSSDMRTVIREATKQGLGASLTSGTHWGTANLPNTYTYKGLPFNADNPSASQVISYGQSAAIAEGASFSGALPQAGVAPAATSNVAARTKRLVGVTAVKVSAGTTLFAQDAIDLSSKVVETDGNYTLNWTNDTGSPRLILTYWQHGSSQTASPSVATNYAINYMDPIGFEAVKAYWEENIFTPALQQVITENGRVEFYMDSLELGQGTCNGGSLWSTKFEQEFKNRRGYDILPYMHLLMCNMSSSWHTGRTYRFGTVATDATLIDKVRNDYYQTITELYQENCLKVFRDWLHTHNITLRVEPGYSMTFEVSTPGKYVDHIENESWEFNTNPDSFRSLSGSAHIYNKVYSSETGACSSNAGYRLPIDYYNQIIQQQFALGIQRTVMHGYAASWGPTATWPGYGPSGINSFAIYMGRRNPFAYNQDDWSMWVARNQKALRQGNPRMDLGILRTEYDMNNRFEEGYAANSAVPGLRQHEGVYWRDNGLQESGYTYEYFAPMNLEEEEMYYDAQKGVVMSNGPAYKALLIYQDMMPVDSAKVLLKWAKQGLPIIIANDTEEIVHGQASTTAANFGIKYEKAATRTVGNDGKEAELAQVMAELKAQPSVIELNPDVAGQKVGAGCSESKAPAALKGLGVYPRAQFLTENQRFITAMRETENEKYVYLYNYQYDAKEFTQGYSWNANRARSDVSPFTTKVSIEGIGKPYFFDASSGKLSEIGAYKFENGRTIVEVTLKGGESTMVVLDKNNTSSPLHALSTDAYKVINKDGKIYAAASKNGTYTTTLSNGQTAVNTFDSVPENIDLSDKWSLMLESWEPGETLTRTEDRPDGFQGVDLPGYTTTERLIATTKLNFDINGGQPLESLVPWKSLSGLYNANRVTGVGYYTTSVTLPADWSAQTRGAYLDIESINQGTAAVYVNGEKVPGGVDVCNPTKDVSAFLKPGENTIRVVVTAANAYNRQSNPSGNNVINYGMTGKTQLVTYEIKSLNSPVIKAATNQSKIVKGQGANEIKVCSVEAMGANVFEVRGTYTGTLQQVKYDQSKYTVVGKAENGVINLTVGVNNTTINGSADLLTFVFDNNADASITLTKGVVAGFTDFNDDDAIYEMDATISPATASVKVYNTVVQICDINGDGKVSMADLSLAMKYYTVAIGDANWAAAQKCDVNGDGIVEMGDLIMILANQTN